MATLQHLLSDTTKLQTISRNRFTILVSSITRVKLSFLDLILVSVVGLVLLLPIPIDKK